MPEARPTKPRDSASVFVPSVTDHGAGPATPVVPADDRGSQTGTPPTRIAVVGLGLIGFSLVLSLAQSGAALFGVEPDSQARRAVAARSDTPLTPGDVAAGPGDFLHEADLVVLAVPIHVLGDVARGVRPFLAPGTTLTDTASLKGKPMRLLEAAAPEHVGVVGSHPMAGKEQGGAQNASADLFRRHPWAITPGTRTRPVDVARVRWLVEQVGAQPVLLEPEAHDRAVAVTSHLPYLAASALTRATARLAEAQPDVTHLLGTGWRDTTRLAAQPAWMDFVCAENADAVAEALDRFVEELLRTRRALSAVTDEAAAALEAAGREGRAAREQLLTPPPGAASDREEEHF